MRRARSTASETPAFVVFAPETDADDWRGLALDPDGRVRAPVADEAMTGPAVLVLPGPAVAARWIEVPPGPRAQETAVASALMARGLAAPSARLRVAVAGREAERPGASRLAIAVDADRLDGWIAEAAERGFRPVAATPDFLLIPEPEDAGAVTAIRFGAHLGLRGQGLAVGVDPALAGALTAGRRLEVITDPEAIEEIMARAARPELDLLAMTTPSAGARRWRLAALLALVALLLPFVAGIAGLARDDAAARGADREVMALARAEGVTADTPEAAIEGLRRAVTAKDAGAAFSVRAAALHGALEATEGAVLETLFYDEEGVLRASVSYSDYAVARALIEAAAARGLTLEETGVIDERGVRQSDFSGIPR